MVKNKFYFYGWLKDFSKWLAASDYYANFFAGIFGAIALALVLTLKGQLCNGKICWINYFIIILVVVLLFFLGGIIIYTYYKVNKKNNNVKNSKVQKNDINNELVSKKNKILIFIKKNWFKIVSVLTVSPNHALNFPSKKHING